jgi:TonB family protein
MFGKAAILCLAIVASAGTAFAQPGESETAKAPSQLSPPPEVILPSPAPQAASSVISSLRKPGYESADTPGVTRPGSALDRALLAYMLPQFYPPHSIRNREQGMVHIEMCVDTNGRSSDSNVLQSSGHDRLDSASLMFIRNLPLKPATLEGKAVPYCGYVFAIAWSLPALPEHEP